MERGQRRVSTDDAGMTRISSGPTFYNGGRTSAQVERYIDSMMEILDFAQKNNMDVSWA
jgi:hypothetical protein